MKKRILMCSESSHIASGFGNYTRQILSRLHNTDKYEIAELSCYRDSSVEKKEPWKVYPVAVQPNHPQYNQFVSNEMNQFGQWRFELAALDFKPHIVFDVRDFWNFTYQETSTLRPFYNWIIAPTYDSAPAKIDVMSTFKNADVLCFHTEWAKNNLLTSYNYTTNNIGPVVSDSVDHNIFKPVSDKKKHKINYGISDDTIVIGSVMRNQKRKLIPDLLKVFSQVVKANKDKNIVLYLHTSFPDSFGWDLPSLLLEHEVYDKVLITYRCSNCDLYYPSVFRGSNSICKRCHTKASHIASVVNSISENELVDIYNIFDMYVQYAICEGFGIPALEAAACGLPVITVDYGAMGEVGRNIGAELVPVHHEFREQETNANRAYPDNDYLLSLLNKYLQIDGSQLREMGDKCRNISQAHYSWDKTAKIFEDIFDNIDISTKLDWDSPQRTINPQYRVDGLSNNHRLIIYDIIDNILQEPFLKNTNFTEELIRNANSGFVNNGSNISKFGPEHYTKILELHLKNKAGVETIRTNPGISMSADLNDFYEYSTQ